MYPRAKIKDHVRYEDFKKGIKKNKPLLDQPSSSRAHFGIMKSLAVGLTWPRIKFTSFQGCQSSVEFLPLIFPLPRPCVGKERSLGIS